MFNEFSAVGLIFDIIGVILLFFYAPMQPDHYADGSFGFKDESPDADEKEKLRQKRKAKYACMSKIALVFILVGFVFQFIATASKF